MCEKDDWVSGQPPRNLLTPTLTQTLTLTLALATGSRVSPFETSLPRP